MSGTLFRQKAILGFTVLVIQENSPTARITASYAAALGCTELGCVNEFRIPGGNIAPTADFRAFEVTLGEADRFVCTIPTDYENVPPTEIYRRQSAYFGHAVVSEIIRQFDDRDAHLAKCRVTNPAPKYTGATMLVDQKSELNSLFPEQENDSRRGFLVTTLPVGFALAIQPVSAQTITTNTDGITAGEVKVPVADGEMPAYRAFPNKGRNFPVTLVIVEIFGVHEHIKDICRRLAKKGHYAIAPALFARQGDPAVVKDMQALMRDIVSKVPDSQVMTDIDSTLAFADKNEGNGKKAAITGFCWGGRVVWLYAAHNPKIKAGVAWYGRMEGQPSALQPKHPIDFAATLKVPVLGLYGGKDQGIPQASIENMREALKKGKSNSDIILYAGAQHGFNADCRPSYGKADAEDAWARMLAWFKKSGA